MNTTAKPGRYCAPAEKDSPANHMPFRPDPDPERSRRGRRSGGTCCSVGEYRGRAALQRRVGCEIEIGLQPRRSEFGQHLSFRQQRRICCFLPTCQPPVSSALACSPIPSHSRLCDLVSSATPVEVHRPRLEHFSSQRGRECARFPGDRHGCLFPGNTLPSARQKPSLPRLH